jgi:hypothetical protein
MIIFMCFRLARYAPSFPLIARSTPNTVTSCSDQYPTLQPTLEAHGYISDISDINQIPCLASDILNVSAINLVFSCLISDVPDIAFLYGFVWSFTYGVPRHGFYSFLFGSARLRFLYSLKHVLWRHTVFRTRPAGFPGFAYGFMYGLNYLVF